MKVGELVRGRVEVELVEQGQDEDAQPDDRHEHRVVEQVEHLVRVRVRVMVRACYCSRVRRSRVQP